MHPPDVWKKAGAALRKENCQMVFKSWNCRQCINSAPVRLQRLDGVPAGIRHGLFVHPDVPEKWVFQRKNPGEENRLVLLVALTAPSDALP